MQTMDPDTNMSSPQRRQIQLKQQPVDSKVSSAFASMFTMVRSASASSSTSAVSSSSSSSASSSSSNYDSDSQATPCTTPQSSPPCTPPSSPPQFEFQHPKLAAALDEEQINLRRLDIPQDALTFDVSVGNNSSNPDSTEPGPAAFFPGQRLAFSPRLRVVQKGGVRLDPCVSSRKTPADAIEQAHPNEERLCGMMLGLVGVAETLSQPLDKNSSSSEPTVRSSRVIADYCTDLTSGMKVWHRDATMARSGRRSHRRRLPCGTYVLPLTMRLPSAERLAPSFESSHYRVRYTLTVAMFTRTASTPSCAMPKLFTSATVPITVLPSTLPSPAPALPALRHTVSSSSGFVPSLLSSVAKLVKEDTPSAADWKVQTSIPTSSYSPSEIVPVTLDIRAPTSTTPSTSVQQVFVRLTLLRRLYVRESANPLEQEDGWGFASPDFPELLWERHEKEEVELGQRWGVVTLPSSVESRDQGRFKLRDIQLPLAGLCEAGAGCTTSIDLAPAQGKPSMYHGESSWFSPAVQDAMETHNDAAWNKHFHVSSRFFVAVEIGFFGSSIPASHNNQPLNEFISCSGPSPFADRKRSTGNKANAAAPAFPGKLRELLVPITVGSVSEPGQAWHIAQSASSGRPINRDPESWQGEARGPTVHGEDGATATPENQGHWVCPPPSYEEALVSAPSYM